MVFSNNKAVEVMQVIKTQVERRGSGKDSKDPLRIITQYWSMEGDLIVEIDPYKSVTEQKNMEKEDLVKLTNDELNDLLKQKGLNPAVETDEDRPVAISILSNLNY